MIIYFGRDTAMRTKNTNDIRKRLSDYINSLTDKYELSKKELILWENDPTTLTGDNDDKIIELNKFIIAYEELMKLPIPDRQLVLIKQCYSYDESRELLDLPNKSISTLSVMVCQAKKKLRKRIIERFNEWGKENF